MINTTQINKSKTQAAEPARALLIESLGRFTQSMGPRVLSFAWSVDEKSEIRILQRAVKSDKLKL